MLVGKDNFASVDQAAAIKFATEVLRIHNTDIQAMAPDVRNYIARIAASAIDATFPSAKPGPEATAVFEQLDREGYATLGRMLDDVKVQEVMNHFLRRPVYNAHLYEPTNDATGLSDNIARRIGDGAENFGAGAYPLADIMTAPHLLELFTSPLVVETMTAYLGAQPTLFSANVLWSFPGQDLGITHGRSYHRDMSHSRFCVLFLYLTDVDDDSGPHQYIRRSHRVDSMDVQLKNRFPALKANDLFASGGRFNDELNGFYEALFEKQLDNICGPAGTVFIEDTYGIHRGMNPRRKARLAAWARYGLYVERPEHSRVPRSLLGVRYPSDERGRYLLRGLVDPD